MKIIASYDNYEAHSFIVGLVAGGKSADQAESRSSDQD
jgi:hypothetical protein